MERLTHIDHLGWYANGHGGERMRGSHIDRLAAYEDTGIDPDELRIIGDIKRFKYEIIFGSKADRLKELSDADKDGRLVLLPCKVGDRVWYITSSTEICEAEVIGIWLNVYTNPQMWLEIKYHSKFTGECEHKSRIDLMLGKTVFLTREEAEAALAQEGGKNE